MFQYLSFLIASISEGFLVSVRALIVAVAADAVLVVMGDDIDDFLCTSDLQHEVCGILHGEHSTEYALEEGGDESSQEEEEYDTAKW